MSRLRRYLDLTPAERRRLFDFTARHDPERHPDHESMERAYMSLAFNHGETQFTCWEGDVLVGAMGVVTSEASVRGEVFITAVAVEPASAACFDELLDRAIAIIPPLPDLTIRMGIHPTHGHLEARARESGCVIEYEGLIMAREPGPLGLDPLQDWEVETVTTANCEDFRRVMDEAFRHSPNGASVSAEQVAEVMAEIAHADLLGLIRWQGRPVAAYELCLQEGVGWIEAVAVAPGCQGQGVGKHAVAAAMARLSAYGVTGIKLLVMSSNVAAVRLYERCGFEVESVTSRWWKVALPASHAKDANPLTKG